VTLEVDKEDDLNWVFIDNLLLTDLDPLLLYSDYIDEDIPFPDLIFTEDIMETNMYLDMNPGALNFDEDIYDA
jgi:hypothetical protein